MPTISLLVSGQFSEKMLNSSLPPKTMSQNRGIKEGTTSWAMETTTLGRLHQKNCRGLNHHFQL